MVDGGVEIKTALSMFHAHLKAFNLLNTNFVFMTCGDWDLQTCLRNEADFKKLSLQPYWKSWINIKASFPGKRYGHRSKRPGVKSFKAMLNIL